MDLERLLSMYRASEYIAEIPVKDQGWFRRY